MKRLTAEKTVRRWMVVLAISLVTLCLCSSCSSTPAASRDVLSQKRIAKERTPITVLIKYAFSINAFEVAVEEKFPDIDIIQVGNYTEAMRPHELEARMQNDDLTDIIMTWPLDVASEYWEDRLIDLSGYAFTGRYNTSMLNTISRGGKLFYLPGPAQVRGIVYNKTLFEENGWQVPSDFNGFVQLCRTIEESGIRSIQLGFKNPEVLDTAFIGYGYADCFAKPKDVQWLADYNAGKGNFLDQFDPALTTFQAMADAGIWKAEDLDIDYSGREQMLFSRKCAMVEDSVLIARKAGSITKDEFALMPFFNPGQEESDWARLYMVCYIGLNKNLTLSQNKAKYEKALQIMDYISTPEGQEALSADTGAMYSSLKGVSPPDIPEIVDLRDALEHGRYSIFPSLPKMESALRDGLVGMLQGSMTKEDVAKQVDKASRISVETEKPEMLGTATETFTLMDTGEWIADTMRAAVDSDIGLFLDIGKDGAMNNLGVTAKLYKGAVTTADIRRILPDLQYGVTGEMYKITMSGENLVHTLENSITSNSMTGWFYYFSGLKMKFDPTAGPGSRILQISMENGEKIDPAKLYSVAVMEQTVPPESIESCEKTGVLIKDLLADALRKEKTISPTRDGRFTLP